MTGSAEATKWEGYFEGGLGGTVKWVNVESVVGFGEQRVLFWKVTVYPNGDLFDMSVDLRRAHCKNEIPHCVMESHAYKNGKYQYQFGGGQICQTDSFIPTDAEIACGLSQRRTFKEEFKNFNEMLKKSEEIRKKYQKHNDFGYVPYLF